MGFTAQLVLFFPGRVHTRIWTSQETIDFGHITRLEKVTNKQRFAHLKFESRQRAGICVMACFLDDIFPKLDQPSKKQFAPRFLDYDELDYQSYEKEFVSAGPGERCFNWRAIYDNEGRNRLRREAIKEHNEAIRKSNSEFSKLIENTHPILNPPILAAHCGELARLLHDSEKTNSEAWTALVQDRISLSLARMWRAYLEEAGKIDAQAVFWFPSW